MHKHKHQFNFAPDLTFTEHNATADGELVTHYTDLARRSLLSESHTVLVHMHNVMTGTKITK